ncbi:hypothetical protein NZK32_01610 [Cyanobium sp. FGCU-52]|nr:hypothetical protein [Cyanobium sp. FGCU52]
MVPAPPPPPSGAASPRHRRAGEPAGTSTWTWPVWLLLGVCFGIGHGLTQRLIDLRPGEATGGRQSFGVKAFPGSGLEGLRTRHRAENRSLRADLDALQDERLKQKEAQELERRQADLERRDQEERERRERDNERLRLEELQRPPAPAPDPTLDAAPPEPLEALPPPPSAGQGTVDPTGQP